MLCSCAGADDTMLENGFASSGMAVGGACRTREDCAESEAVRKLANVRCAPQEVYCADEVCHASCRVQCDAHSAAANPCDEGELCAAPSPRGLPLFCTALPIPCSALEQCPLFRPTDDDGAQHQWACVDESCQYPGYEYRGR
jgi:hypothetical protein